jgi:hypothetical protein
MSEPSLTGEVATNAAVGATLLIVTVALYVLTPPSLSRTLPPTVRVPLSLVEQVAVLVVLNAPKPAPRRTSTGARRWCPRSTGPTRRSATDRSLSLRSLRRER